MEQSIQIQISPDELRAIIREEVKVLSQPQTEKAEPSQQYMTKKELATFARMSPGLVNRLANEGKFIRHRVGGRVLFDRDQVLEAIKSGSAVKCSRK